MDRLFRNYFYNIIYQIFLIIVPLVTAPYLARVFGPANLGVFNYVTSVSSIFCTLGLLGVYNYGCRQIAYVRGDKEAVTRVFYELMLMRLGLCLVGAIVYAALFAKSEYSRYFGIQYLFVAAHYLDVSWVFVGMEDMGPPVLKNFLAKFVSVVGTFVFVKTADDLWKFVLLVAGMMLLANLSIYPQLKQYVGRPRIDMSAFGDHLAGSLQLFLPQIATMLYLQSGKVLIEYFSGSTEQVAFYDNAEKIVKIPLAFITALGVVMMPRLANAFSNNDASAIRGYVVRVIHFSAMLAFPMAIGIACIAPWFIPWYLGDEFLPAITAIVLLSPIILTNAYSGVSGTQYFTATNQTWVLTRSYVYAAAANLLVNLVLIPRYGFIGAAIGTLAAEAVCVVTHYAVLGRQMEIGEIYARGGEYLLAAAFMGGAVYLIGLARGAGAVTTLLQISTGSAVYAASLWLSKDETFLFFLRKVTGAIDSWRGRAKAS